MPCPSRAASLLFLLLFAGFTQLPYAAAAIFKCRSTDGHWSYADRPETSCRGSWTIFHPLPAMRQARPAPHTRPTRRPPPVVRRVVQRRLRRWQATLQELRTTRVPRDRTLALWRAQALHIVAADIGRLHQTLNLQDRSHPP